MVRAKPDRLIDEPRAGHDEKRRPQRQLRLLRGHGLLRKVAHTHRYLLTAKGRVVVAALLAARQADTATLAAAA